MPPPLETSKLYQMEQQDARKLVNELGDNVTVIHGDVRTRCKAIVEWDPDKMQGAGQSDRRTRADMGEVEVLREDVPVATRGETVVVLLSPEGETRAYPVKIVLDATPVWWKLAVGR